MNFIETCLDFYDDRKYICFILASWEYSVLHHATWQRVYLVGATDNLRSIEIELMSQLSVKSEEILNQLQVQISYQDYEDRN